LLFGIQAGNVWVFGDLADGFFDHLLPHHCIQPIQIGVALLGHVYVMHDELSRSLMSEKYFVIIAKRAEDKKAPAKRQGLFLVYVAKASSLRAA